MAAQKLDPYINVDPWDNEPIQHGEVYVTEDGAETDLDWVIRNFIDEGSEQVLQPYDRKVFWNVLSKERAGEYLGSTVQISLM